MTHAPRPRCDFTDLYTDECHHCQPAARPGPVITTQQLTQALADPDTIDRYRPATRARLSQQWGFGRLAPAKNGAYEAGGQLGRVPVRVTCDHPTPSDEPICHDCWALVEVCLGDIPALVQDLQSAIRRDTTFVVHGTWHDTTPDGDAGTPTPHNTTASTALHEISDALDDLAQPVAGYRLDLPRPMPTDHGQRAVVRSRQILRHAPTIRRHPTVNDLAATLTGRVVRALKIVDRPPDRTYLGPCPVTDMTGAPCPGHLNAVRDADTVTCPACDTAYDVRTLLDQWANRAGDYWLSKADLLFALPDLKPWMLKRWENREGLARDRVSQILPDANGTLVPTMITVYHLGAVQQLLAEHLQQVTARDAERAAQTAAKAQPLTSQQAAERLQIKPAALRKLVQRGKITPLRAGAQPLTFAAAEVERAHALRKGRQAS